MFDVHQTSAAAYSVSVEGDVFRFRDANAAAITLAGLTIHAHAGLTPHDCFPPAVAETILARYRTCRDSRTAITYINEARGRTWHTTLFPELDANGMVVGLVGISIEAPMNSAEAVGASFRDKVSLAIDAIDGGFWVYELATGAFEMSKPLAELLAGPGHAPLSLAEYVGCVHEEDLPKYSLLIEQVDRSKVEFRVITYDGRTRWLQSKRRVVRDDTGAPVRIVSLVVDVTEQKSAIRTLEVKASTDSLTRLRNRRAFDTLGALAWSHARAGGRTLGLLIFDLDGFKPINDHHGHRAGDAILRQVARRIARFVRKDDALARIGGDEFAILLGKTDRGTGEAMAAKVQRAFEKPFVLDGVDTTIGASIGYAVSAPDDIDFEDLVTRADKALYAAKRRRQLLTA